MYVFKVYYLVGGDIHIWRTVAKNIPDVCSKFKGPIVGIVREGYRLEKDK